MQTLQRHNDDAAAGRARARRVYPSRSGVERAPSGDELAQNYLAVNQQMLDVLEGPFEKFWERAQAIQADLQAILRSLAKPATQTSRGRAQKERSPSLEVVESDAKATGKTVGRADKQRGPEKRKGRRRRLRGKH
jgi:hypothetical protein